MSEIGVASGVAVAVAWGAEGDGFDFDGEDSTTTAVISNKNPRPIGSARKSRRIVGRCSRTLSSSPWLLNEVFMGPAVTTTPTVRT